MDGGSEGGFGCSVTGAHGLNSIFPVRPGVSASVNASRDCSSEKTPPTETGSSPLRIFRPAHQRGHPKSAHNQFVRNHSTRIQAHRLTRQPAKMINSPRAASNCCISIVWAPDTESIARSIGAPAVKSETPLCFAHQDTTDGASGGILHDPISRLHAQLFEQHEPKAASRAADTRLSSGIESGTGTSDDCCAIAYSAHAPCVMHTTRVPARSDRPSPNHRWRATAVSRRRRRELSRDRGCEWASEARAIAPGQVRLAADPHPSKPRR